MQDVADFVLTLKIVKSKLKDKPKIEELEKQSKEIGRLIHKIQGLCSHPKANMKEWNLVGRCPDCQKKLRIRRIEGNIY